MRRILLVFLLALCAVGWAQPEEATGEPAAGEEQATEAEETVEEPAQPAEEEEPAAEPAAGEGEYQEGEAQERQQSASMDLIDLFIAGGGFMWPILIALLIGLAVAIERFFTFQRAKVNVPKFLDNIGGYLRKGDMEGAESYCDRTSGPVASILRAGLLRRDKGLEAVEKAIESAGGIEMAFLEKRLVVLASVASIGPMLGFLGTVSGMIRAFGEIAAAKNVEASLVAGGIQEALITTASGLIIAIPIQAAHNYFIARIGSFVTDMEEASSFLIDSLADMEQLKQL